MIALLLTLLSSPALAVPTPPAATPVPVEVAAEPEEAEATVASLVIQVTQPTEAADALVAKVKERGGWFQSRTSDAVSLRVPVAQAEALIADASALGKVADRSVQRSDLTRDLAELRGRLQAREQVLERYYVVLAEAGPKSIVAVERQIVGAITQIEQLKGRIRLLEDQAAYARVDVSFRFRDRTAPAQDGSSSFAWLNTLNVQGVVWGLQTQWPDWKTTDVDIAAPPEGFSAWKKTNRYRAASPDGVLYRVRTEKKQPEADLAFWKEAVRDRMKAAGYKVVAEADVKAHGVDGGLIELAAPVGEEDWTYLVAFFPMGKRIVVAEAAGEVTAFDGRREALTKAMGK